MNDVKKQYFQEIKRLLPCNAKEKNRCIMELERDVDDFLEYCPSTTFDILCAAIGTPQSIAESFLERIDPEQLSHKVSAKRKIAIGVVAVVAMLAITLGVIAVAFADDIHQYFNGYYVDRLDVDEYEVLPSDAESTPVPIAEY